MTDHIKLLGLLLNIMAGILLLGYLFQQKKQHGEKVLNLLILNSGAVVLGITLFYVAMYLNVNIPRITGSSDHAHLPDALLILLGYIIIITASCSVVLLYYPILKTSPPPWLKRVGLLFILFTLIPFIPYLTLPAGSTLHAVADGFVENFGIVFFILEIFYLIKLLVKSARLSDADHKKVTRIFPILFLGRYLLLAGFVLLIPSVIRGFLFFIYWHVSCFVWVKYFYIPYLRNVEERRDTGAIISLLEGKFALSKRETEILQLMLLGKNNREIEDQLYISYNTVKNHIHAIYNKIGVRNRYQLFKMADGYK